MANLQTEKVISVRHWNDRLFSFKTTRNQNFRFKNGQFTMVGKKIAGDTVLRAYSMASANYEDHLEFYSIKTPGGLLTSKLKLLEVGDEVLVNSKATGSLLLENLIAGDRLFLLSTGTGIAPFLSIIHDFEVYDSFDQIILVHCVRTKNELAYRNFLEKEINDDAYLGKNARSKFIYYPTVTQEVFHHQGRITFLIKSGTIEKDLGIQKINPDTDRLMLCGSDSFIKDMSRILKEKGFSEHKSGLPGHFVYELAFVKN